MLRTCGSRPILTTNLTTNEIPLVSTALGKTLENRAFAGTLVPVFYGSRRVRIPPTAPTKNPVTMPVTGFSCILKTVRWMSGSKKAAADE